MMFDYLDDYEVKHETRRSLNSIHGPDCVDCHTPKLSPDKPDADQADALRRAFGTKAPAKLRPAKQDELFNPKPQARFTF